MPKSGFPTVNVTLPVQMAKDLIYALTQALEGSGGGKTKGGSQQPSGKNVTGKSSNVTGKNASGNVTGKSANVTAKRSVTGKQTKARTGKR